MLRLDLGNGVVLDENNRLAVIEYTESDDYETEMRLNSKNIFGALKELEKQIPEEIKVYIDRPLEPELKAKIGIENLDLTVIKTHEMKENISNLAGAVFINFKNYSEELQKLIKGTNNYLISFKCPSYEVEAMRMIDKI